MFKKKLMACVLLLVFCLAHAVSVQASFCNAERDKVWNGKLVNVYVAGHAFPGKIVGMTEKELKLEVNQITGGGVVAPGVAIWSAWINCDDILAVTWQAESATKAEGAIQNGKMMGQ